VVLQCDASLPRRALFAFDYKQKDVVVLSKQREPEVRRITILSSQMRQSIIDRSKQAIRGLTVQKKRHKVGTLKFTSRISSILLKKHGRTYHVRGERVKIQNIKQPLRVRGTNQIPRDVELASAELILRNGYYFVHVTTYQNPKSNEPMPKRAAKTKVIGVDAGIRNQLTLSNGVVIKCDVPLPVGRVRRVHRELSRRRLLRGKNWSKTKLTLDKICGKTSNRRRDVRAQDCELSHIQL
jgi:transposase